MPTDDTYNNTLNITQFDVMGVIERIIDVDGLEAARAAFKQMNEYFSGMKGWAETTTAVYGLFAEKRKEEKLQKREEKLEEQRAAASRFVVVSQANNDAKNIGTADIDEMKVDVSSPGNNIARVINLGKDNQN